LDGEDAIEEEVQTMSRSTDAIPTEGESPGPQANAATAGKFVCPFCGTICDRSDAPCPRCLMENTPQTRQTTRARLGPWYVLQSRNLSAPGMKCATLLALIRKGQVTPRSIIRGPTTQQFWRSAARVKGISREFGLCYYCGAAVQPAAQSCSRCNKPQELPPNPDALLEGETPARTLYVDVSPKSTSANGPLKEPSSALPEATAADSTEPLGINRPGSPARPPVPAPSAAQTMAVVAGLQPPDTAGPESRSRPQQTREKILSARELAAAFSLQFDPRSDARTPLPARRDRRRTPIALVLSGAAVLAAGGLMFVPALRQPLWDLLKRAVPPAAPVATPQPLKVDASDRPPWAMKPPVVSPPAAPAEATPSPSDSSRKPAVVEKPAVPSGTPAVSASDLDSLAMRLRANGLDAEAKHDYAAAQYFYEQIEKLPREHWPADADQLLQNARKMNQSASGEQR